MSASTETIAAARSRSAILVPAALCGIVILGAIVSLPGIHWLIGYGPTRDFSFHVDDERFVVLAQHFFDVRALTQPYPYFMAVQLFAVHAFLHDLLRLPLNDAVVLRCISMAYAAAGLVLCYVFSRWLGFSRIVALLAAYFLAAAPLHVVTAHFGTSDMSALFLFYLTIVAAWRYRAGGAEAWLYAAAAVAGVALADKFYLPALVPPAMLVLGLPRARRGSASFLMACVGVACFCAASFFSYTPAAFGGLMGMLATDNVVVVAGKSPPQQIYLYLWDAITCCGVVPAVLACIEAVVLLLRWKRQAARGVRAWLRSPAAIVAVPLAVCAGLIVLAQVHYDRHILVFMPPIALLAAMAVGEAIELLTTSPRAIAAAGFAAIAVILAIQFADAMATDWAFPDDPRAKLAGFLAEKKLTAGASTTSAYTRLKGVALIGDLPRTPVFIGCDIEYNRYIRAGSGDPVFHLAGGQRRADFYIALLAGKTAYRQIFDNVRPRHSIEDLLARAGWLRELEYYVPDECRAFARPAAGQ